MIINVFPVFLKMYVLRDASFPVKHAKVKRICVYLVKRGIIFPIRKINVIGVIISARLAMSRESV